MERCKEYRTLKGCGKCTVNLKNIDDLSYLGLLSITTMASSLLRSTKLNSNKVNLGRLIIPCNGLI